MTSARTSGVLVHPTSFPSPFGIGDLGPDARHFIDWLAGARQTVWQILPLGPVDEHGSPYKSPSAFGGNSLLISPDGLMEDGLLTADELAEVSCAPVGNCHRVDFRSVGVRKGRLFATAYARFLQWADVHPLKAEFAAFCRDEGLWLADHAMFMALGDANGTTRWHEWTVGVTDDKRAARASQEMLRDRIGYHSFLQFQFFRQWRALRVYAHRLGVQIIGDMPIYVAPDSVDVWAHRARFELDEDGCPIRVSGVPPDYFSATGQLWNNPLYDWDEMQRSGFSWWRARFRSILSLVDLVRIDHFRGFEAYWSVPAGEETAENGRWVPGPGAALLDALVDECAGLESDGEWEGALPVIAEDLGVITPPVDALRRQFGLPGMAVLQFAFGGEERFRPENIERNTVAYTGTHDNDTSRGWFESDVLARPEVLSQWRRYLSCVVDDVAWELLELAWETDARIAVAPLQDVLGLGSAARMNLPGVEGGNWSWRFGREALTREVQARLAALTHRCGRCG